MITAKFGSKSFEVSPKKIYTPNGLSLSEELNYEEIEVSGKKPTITVKGFKLIPLTFEVKLDSRFVDIEKEMAEWKSLLRKKTSKNFNYGGTLLGYFYLTKYEVKETTINSSGKYTQAKISLSFIEDGEYYNGTKKVTTLKTGTGTSVTPTGTAKSSTVKSSGSSSSKAKVRKGSTIKPKKNTRWYYTAEGAIKKTGKSGTAYQKNMTVTYTYSKNGKIVCVNPQSLGWLKVEDISVIKY